VSTGITPGEKFDSFIMETISARATKLDEFYDAVESAIISGDFTLTEEDKKPISSYHQQEKWKRTVRNRLGNHWKDKGRVAHLGDGLYSSPRPCEDPIDTQKFWSEVRLSSINWPESEPVAIHDGVSWFIKSANRKTIFFRAEDSTEEMKFDRKRIENMAIALNTAGGSGNWRTLAGNRWVYSKALVSLSPSIEFTDESCEMVRICGVVPENSDEMNFDVEKAKNAIAERTKKPGKVRVGQRAFRRGVLKNYEDESGNSRCAVSGTGVPEAIDAAHIIPFNGFLTNHISNGIPLRRDIHRLFDLFLIRIGPEDLSINIHPDIQDEYSDMCLEKLVDSIDPEMRPNQEALRMVWEMGEERWG
jgi:hypothetical protein